VRNAGKGGFEKMKRYRLSLCVTCLLYHSRCPLAGMTDGFGEPLEGYIFECLSYENTVHQARDTRIWIHDK
jgi:hypothetical protein